MVKPEGEIIGGLCSTIITLSCVLCGVELTGWGHNAQPVAEGRCCFDCNYKVVIINRLEKLVQNLKTEEE